MEPEDIEFGEEAEFERRTPAGLALTLSLTGEEARILSRLTKDRGITYAQFATDVLRRALHKAERDSLPTSTTDHTRVRSVRIITP